MLASRNPTLYVAWQSVNESMKQGSQVGKCVYMCRCVYGKMIKLPIPAEHLTSRVAQFLSC